MLSHVAEVGGLTDISPSHAIAYGRAFSNNRSDLSESKLDVPPRIAFVPSFGLTLGGRAAPLPVLSGARCSSDDASCETIFLNSGTSCNESRSASFFIHSRSGNPSLMERRKSAIDWAR